MEPSSVDEDDSGGPDANPTASPVRIAVGLRVSIITLIIDIR